MWPGCRSRSQPIRLRAIAQIGKLSRELEKAQPNKGHGVTTGEKTKADQLKDAGLSTSTANRYEQLASPSEQAAPAVDETPETVSASRQDRVKDRRSEVFPDGLR